MSNEKTLEELKAELENLKKQNLERELALEKAKLEEAEKAEKTKQEEQLKEKIRGELLEEMKGKSTVEQETEEKLGEKNKYDVFMDRMKKKYNLKGISYEDLTRQITDPGNFKGERK